MQGINASVIFFILVFAVFNMLHVCLFDLMSPTDATDAVNQLL